MTKTITLRLLLAAAMLAPAASPARADGPVAQRTATDEQAAFAADRASILAMAGDYKVTFDFRETTPWRADYTPIAPKVSGGHESVRVIEDSGRRIVLQHLLVVPGDAGKTVVVKHWRQDWTYEPVEVLVYAGKGRWTIEAVPERMRKGRWSQTVWQTDDSPRYGGWGEWTSEGGVRRWRSNWTWRPLARRDAVRHPPYDRYLAINRHSPSPAGWIHWQDNIKMGPDTAAADAKIVPFVQESVLNSYVRDGAFDVKAADDYWNATRDYWAAVRTIWDEAIARGRGVAVPEIAETGSASGERLMAYADDIQAGKLTTGKAISQARAVIAEVTR
ncbi:hypothetical protein SAMN05518801_105173 [Novosphingobium sp. CF614]|uniref:DUF6607 family protein n=1 Tax=Novosphingobium sp. CF614 TaxID=1884364 RepID=UPI0008DF0D52|nr:DUF6607 family protein [Novosphingobium sp. CF614]SFG01238.1 hypothetical protein SAMN05518801_105173 [Novosphingobium sp. CF614]